MEMVNRLTADLFQRTTDGKVVFRPYRRFGRVYEVASERERREIYIRLRQWHAFYIPFVIFEMLVALWILPANPMLALAIGSLMVLLYFVRMHSLALELKHGREAKAAAPRTKRSSAPTAADERWKWR